MIPPGRPTRLSPSVHSASVHQVRPSQHTQHSVRVGSADCIKALRSAFVEPERRLHARAIAIQTGQSLNMRLRFTRGFGSITEVQTHEPMLFRFGPTLIGKQAGFVALDASEGHLYNAA